MLVMGKAGHDGSKNKTLRLRHGTIPERLAPLRGMADDARVQHRGRKTGENP